MSYVFNMVGGESGESSEIACIGVTYPAGSICTCSDGIITLTADDTSGVFLFSIPNAGTWTVSCTDGTDSANSSVSVAVNHAYNIALEYFQLEPFGTTSDENFVKMIRAAHNGSLDLQSDAGWQVGDKRTISISAFTGKGSYGNNKTNNAQNMDIAISSFEDYENCGCVMQFDFVYPLETDFSMNASATNNGGYDNSQMYLVTLPALVNALPAYLRNLLIEFSCLASSGNGSNAISIVYGNKLALRSDIEINGKLNYSASGEGSLIPYYTTSSRRTKKKPTNTQDNYNPWWTRSPSYGSSKPTQCFIMIYHSTYSNPSWADDHRGVAPFGCI